MNRKMTGLLILTAFAALPAAAQSNDLGAVTRSNIAAATIDPNPMPAVGGAGSTASLKQQIAAVRRYSTGKVYDFVRPKQADFFPGKSSSADTAGAATAGLPR